MTMISTMGTMSCATIAIGNFGKNGSEQIDKNEAYKSEGLVEETEGLTPDQFYRDILYPVRQDLGRTRDYPFTKMMELIDSSKLKTKFIIATLNLYQYQTKDRYWHKELLSWGFELKDKTKNSIGSVNYVYVRNPSRVEIKKGEADA